MMSFNQRLTDIAKVVTGYGPGTPSTAVPDYVSLKGYGRCTIIIQVLNGSTVTGSAVTVKQASAVANTGEKALAFSSVLANVDTGTGDTFTNTTVSSNTFTTNTTNSKGLLYVIDVTEDMLDVANNFDCVRLGLGDAANTSICATYILHPAKFAAGGGPTPSAITD